MADKKDKAPEAAPAPADAAPGKKKLPLKTLIVVGALMLAEGAAVFFVVGMLGGPREGKAETEAKHVEHDESEETTEVEIASEKFQNLTTGRVWVWDVSVFVQVKNRNSERVEKVLEQRNAEIKEGISQIISRAQHAQLKEPERQSINRQFGAFLEKVIGSDAEGKPLVERILIPKCRGYPADF